MGSAAATILVAQTALGFRMVLAFWTIAELAIRTLLMIASRIVLEFGAVIRTTVLVEFAMVTALLVLTAPGHPMEMRSKTSVAYATSTPLTIANWIALACGGETQLWTPATFVKAMGPRV